ncbi:MAG: type IX secretion system membrane protein PorP/SprF, partial [Bacteroidota bacterium]
VLFLMQGPSTEIDLGCMVRYTLREESRYTGLLKETAILIGGYFRVGDAVIPSVMFEIANFAIGVSYDVNISGLKSVSTGRGGAEISLRYINPNPFRYGKGTRGTPML